MTRFLALKAFKLVVLLAAVSAISFALLSFSPVDPVRAYVGADMMLVTPEQREAIAERWGVDQPPTEQFLKWTSRLVQGDLGTSLIYRQPVAKVIAERFSASLLLMMSAWLLTGVFGYLFGIVSGTLEGSRVDKGIQLYAFTLASMPTFWLALLMLM
ncbi:MAG: ABC transporter permease, partial [Coriobacteriia bacterium]|nr:ABC transporter permease [Coriobacteriia bacterium]